MIDPAERPAPSNPWWLKLTLIAIVLTVPLQRLRGSFPTGRFFHSDIAFLPALFDDVTSGGSLSAWGLPEAPYFIPDWPLYFIAWLVTPSYASGQALFALFQIALLVWLWLRLAKWLTPEPMVATAIGVGILIAAALAGQVPADYATVSFAHFGTFLLTLASLALYLAAKLNRTAVGFVARPRPGWALLTGIGALTLVGTVSDRVLISWWVLPALAIEALLLLEQRILPAKVRAWLVPTGSWRLIAVYLTSMVVGLVVRPTLVRPSGDYAVELLPDLPLSVRFDILFRSFFRSELIEFSPWYSVLVFACGFVWLWLWWQRRDDAPFFLFTLWFALATVSSLSAEFIIADAAWRYHQFLYHLPVLVVGLWLTPLLARFRVRATTVAAVGAAGLLAWGALPVSALALDRRPEEVTCLDQVLAESGSRVGVGNYAASRLAVVDSDFDLEVGSRNTWFAPEEDVHSRDWARDSADFVILYTTIFGAIPHNTIRSLATTEPTDVTCGYWRILDFGPGGLDLDRLDTIGGSAVAPGCWFTNAVGTPSDGCTLRVTADQLTSTSGDYVGFGAYYPTEPGSYRLSAQLGETPPGTLGPDGVFEVALWEANSGRFVSSTNVRLPATSIVIDVPTDGPELSLEGRILYEGGGELIIETMVIERIG